MQTELRVLLTIIILFVVEHTCGILYTIERLLKVEWYFRNFRVFSLIRHGTFHFDESIFTDFYPFLLSMNLFDQMSLILRKYFLKITSINTQLHSFEVVHVNVKFSIHCIKCLGYPKCTSLGE